MSVLDVVLHGDPIPKGRPRTGNGVTYTPPRTRTAEKAVKAVVATKMLGRGPVEGPIGLAVEFYCQTRRRTDGDNLLKLITDAMNGLVYVDDSQIEEWFCRVHRGVGKETARTEILVYELPPQG